MNQQQHTGDGINIYRRLLSHVLPYWKIFLLAIFGMIIFSVTEGAFTKLIEPMVDGSFVKKDPAAIKWVPILMIVVFAIRMVGSFLSEYGMAWVARSVIRDLRSLVFKKLLLVPVRFYETTSSGYLLSKMVYDLEQVAEATSGVVTTLIRDSLTVIVLVLYMLYVSMTLTLMLLVVAPFIIFLVYIVSNRFRKLSRRIQNSMGGVSTITEETIQANREVKIFNGQDYELNRFEEVNRYNRRQHLKLAATNSLSAPIIQFIVVSAFALIVYVATQPEFIKDMTVGKFMSFMLAMILLLQHAKKLTSINLHLQRGIAAAQSIFALIDQQPERDGGTVELESITGKVEFRDVAFRYEASDGNVLEKFNLTIEPGQSVAFVGRSGAGKTTLVNLLPRFYDITGGQLLIDGNEINSLTLKNLRSHIAMVSQHVTLFNDTIAHNIAYGALETANDDAIYAAAKAAHALEFIQTLPEGMQTIVGEDGVMLSGGQRQRLAIARAILKDAPILILDEATSALDTESERHIQIALEELMHNRTTLVIAHRLSTIEKVDKIVVLEQGKIVEVGQHNELLARNGKYAALYNMQFRDNSPGSTELE